MAHLLRPWLVYALRDPRDRSPRYVGTTTLSLAMRLSQHISTRSRAATAKSAWLDGLEADGLRPLIEPLPRRRKRKMGPSAVARIVDDVLTDLASSTTP